VSSRAAQAELHRPPVQPQDYEMVEFFIKRLKLWMGLTKAKEVHRRRICSQIIPEAVAESTRVFFSLFKFRHRVKFKGMDVAPSRSSQDSRLSTPSSSRSPSSPSSLSPPRPPSSSLSARSEDSSGSDGGFDVRPHLDRLLPGVSALLSGFDRVNRITEDVHDLETRLEEARARRRRRRKWIGNEGGEMLGEPERPKDPEGEGRDAGEVRHRKRGVSYPEPRVSLPSSFSFASPSSAASACRYPRTRSTESEPAPLRPRASSNIHAPGAAELSTGLSGSGPADSPGRGGFPRRRAWHSGSSHSADAAHRILHAPQGGGVAPCDVGGDRLAFANTGPGSDEGVRRHIRDDGVPVKRKAWTEQD